ncbi:MAG: hypothetical protein R3C69_05280 [Geminicoccaceae bacterium]
MLKNKAINAVGIIVTFACIGLFFDSFTNLDFWQLAHLPRMELFAVTATATMIYASLLVAVGIGFASLVRSTGHAMATPQEGIALWGQANIAKYLPGNVMHFAGRQLLARRFDWPQASTTTASVLELALQVLMSCSIGVAGLLMIDRMNTEVASSWLVAALFLSSAVLTVALLGRLPLAWLPAIARRLLAAFSLEDLRTFSRSTLLYGAFFIGQGLVGWLVYSWLLGVADAAILPGVVAIVLLGWCAGLVVPGAPGGLGVREATMVLLGAPFLDNDSLMLMTILLRVISLAGEGLMFALACQLPRRRSPMAKVS